MNGAGTEWEQRAIPSQGAVFSAIRTADDGHTLRADVFGKGHQYGEPHRLVVTCDPLKYDDGASPAERLPTVLELLGAADELTPGEVLSLMFFGNPEGVPRVEMPPGVPRTVEVTQVGELQGKRIQVVGA